jgi:hypothetical protein
MYSLQPPVVTCKPPNCTTFEGCPCVGLVFCNCSDCEESVPFVAPMCSFSCFRYLACVLFHGELPQATLMASHAPSLHLHAQKVLGADK